MKGLDSGYYTVEGGKYVRYPSHEGHTLTMELPPLIDICAHTASPFYNDIETLEHLSTSAIGNGFGSVVLHPYDVGQAQIIESMPSSVTVNGLLINYLKPVTEAVTGKKLVMAKASRKSEAFSDGYFSRIALPTLALALQSARTANDLVIVKPWHSHVPDPYYTYDDATTTLAGITGIEAEYEKSLVSQALEIHAREGGRLHISGVCQIDTLELLEQYAENSEQQSITYDVPISHLTASNARLAGFYPQAKLLPPLTNEENRKALISFFAKSESRIASLASHHYPVRVEDKFCDLASASFGCGQYEGLLASLIECFLAHEVALDKVLDKIFLYLYANPAYVLDGGLPASQMRIFKLEAQNTISAHNQFFNAAYTLSPL